MGSENFLTVFFFKFFTIKFFFQILKITAIFFENFISLNFKMLRTALKFISYQQIRTLSLQENVAMNILNDHGITTPKFRVAKTEQEAEQGAKDLLTKNLMVKAQVLAGGRGLGRFDNGFHGGVHSATK